MKIRIAYIITRIEKRGPGAIVINLLKGLDKERYLPILVCLFNESELEVIRELKECGIHVVECNFMSRQKLIIKDYLKLEKWLQQRADIIHSHGFTSDLAVSRMKGLPLRVSTIHNIMKNDYIDEHGLIMGMLQRHIHIKALYSFSQVIGCSQRVGETLKGLPNSTYIRNGISVVSDGCKSRDELGIPKQAAVFVFAGRMSSLKNVVGLVELFNRYHGDYDYLVMVGDGAELEKCKSISDSHIIFTGFQNDPIQFLNMADVYISNSKSEGFSISVIEALSCGLMLCLSEIESHKEVFEIDKNMYLGEMFNSKNFGRKLKLLKTHIWEKEKIKDFYKKRLSSDIMVHRYQLLYDKLIGNNKNEC